MKHLFLVCGLILFGVMAGHAQIRINAYTSYVFDDSFDSRYSSTSYFNGRINGGLQWGVGLEFTPSETFGFELLYLRQDTDVPVNYWRDGPQSAVLDVGINYIMAGGNFYLPTGGVFEPYGGLQAGMVIYSNKNAVEGEPSTETKFAWGGRLGANIWVLDGFGLKVQASLQSAVESVGGGFYFGTGGAGAGVSTYSTLYQFGLGGGAVLRLGGR